MYGTLAKMGKDSLIAFVREEERKLYSITGRKRILELEISGLSAFTAIVRRKSDGKKEIVYQNLYRHCRLMTEAAYFKQMHSQGLEIEKNEVILPFLLQVRYTLNLSASGRGLSN